MRLALPAFLLALLASASALAAGPENTLYIDLKDNCRVVIEMRPDLAPKHVAQIKKLAREGKYDGIVFHRVIAGFMAQTGDPEGTGKGGMGEKLPAEFSKEPHVRGAVSMARTPNDINSARSQFFIVLKDSNFLDGQYTVWGEVTNGMDAVDALPKGEPPRSPGKIVTAKVAADA